MNSPNAIRPWLILGRVSNLPTVWSNCLAGWLLTHASGHWSRFALLCLGATLLYVGGMYLNDAFDAAFDAQHRRERPIPSGKVSSTAVWTAGVALIVAGVIVFLPMGRMAGVCALMLAGCIVVYDAVHKLVTFSPILMALCRFFLYLTASAAVGGMVSGAAIWGGLALSAYVVGLSYLARIESTRGVVPAMPLLLLLVPVGLAFLVHDGDYRKGALLVAVILVLWAARCLRSAFVEPRNVGRAVAGLLAGIVWVDLLAVADQPRPVGAIFMAFFGLSLLFQRFVPAT